MTEVEVKILEIDVPSIESKLVALGATKVFEGDIQASLYDFPDQRLNQDRSFIRLRTKGEKAEFVFKKHIANEVAESYDELEVEVSDIEVTRKILEKIGLVETVHGVRKHRITYAADNAHFELDKFEGMPAFFEIEVSDSDELPKWVELLGYTMDDAKSWSGRDVYKHYGVPYPTV